MIWETGPERGLNLASFGSPSFMQTEKIQTGPSQLLYFLLPFFLLKSVNNEGAVWTKNNSVAVKLKINIPPQQYKRVKQTCSDVLGFLLTADNNGWNLKAAPSRKSLPVETISVLRTHIQVKLKRQTKHTYFVIVCSSLIVWDSHVTSSSSYLKTVVHILCLSVCAVCTNCCNVYNIA